MTRGYPKRYIHSVSWEVEYTDEFEVWWETLTDPEQASIAAVVGLLEDQGLASLKREGLI